jgi:hypothetical protein
MKKLCRKSGKVKFDTHEQAAIRAGEILTLPHNPTRELWTYLCGFCGKWHMTHRAPVRPPG